MNLIDIYDTYDSVLSAVRSFGRSHGLREIMPDPTAPAFEFVPARTYFVGDEDDPALVLPASNTLQKQVACGVLGSVFCIAPCFRREAPESRPRWSLDVFHQIEVEIRDADEGVARETALSLLRHIASAFPERGPPVRAALDDVATIDLRSIPDPPSYEAYDDWLDEHLDPAAATWVLHLPQNPLLPINRSVDGTRLSETFELILPDGYGEILSGGARDPSTAKSMWRRASLDDSFDVSTSGFGIGLERLVARLLESRDLAVIRPPHFTA